MTRPRRSAMFIALALLSLGAVARAASPRLYTKPDPSAGGGITGHIAKPGLPIEQILAIPPDEPRLVYEGRITGTDRRTFRFEGLPVNKYDLVAIYEGRFYEGLRLHRGESTLSAEDVKKITATVQKSEPFFTKKVLHRIEGTTGKGNFARCICTFVRQKFSIEALERTRQEHRRTFKLVIMKDVGPGWQVARTRDLYPVYVQPNRGLPDHRHAKALSGIRVTTSVKDVGDLDLTR